MVSAEAVVSQQPAGGGGGGGGGGASRFAVLQPIHDAAGSSGELPVVQGQTEDEAIGHEAAGLLAELEGNVGARLGELMEAVAVLLQAADILQAAAVLTRTLTALEGGAAGEIAGLSEDVAGAMAAECHAGLGQCLRRRRPASSDQPQQQQQVHAANVDYPQA